MYVILSSLVWFISDPVPPATPAVVDQPRGSPVRQGSAGSATSQLTVPEGRFEACAEDSDPDDNSSVSIDEGVLPTDAMVSTFYTTPPLTRRCKDHFAGSRPSSVASLVNLGSRPSSRAGIASLNLVDPPSRPTSRLSNHFSSRPSSRSTSPTSPTSKYKANEQPVGAVHIIITESDVPKHAVTA